jgi:outer membrane murein-binding lipoprotein Lpp
MWRYALSGAVTLIVALLLYGSAQLSKIPVLETKQQNLEVNVSQMAEDIRAIRNWMVGPPPSSGQR